jgi:hypothetical protein
MKAKLRVTISNGIKLFVPKYGERITYPRNNKIEYFSPLLGNAINNTGLTNGITAKDMGVFEEINE